MPDTIHTIDIKLAAILATEEIPQRFEQPITCRREEREGKPHNQFRFWFDVSDEGVRDKAERIMSEYHGIRREIQDSIRTAKMDGAKVVKFPDTDITKMISAQMWRDAYLHWMKNYVEPMRTVQMGDKTVTLSANATKETKDKIRQAL
jgi:hypothetical protein